MRKLFFLIFVLLFASSAYALDNKAPAPTYHWSVWGDGFTLFGSAEAACFETFAKPDTSGLNIYGIGGPDSRYPPQDDGSVSCLSKPKNGADPASFIAWIKVGALCTGGSVPTGDQKACQCKGSELYYEKYAQCGNKYNGPGPRKEPKICPKPTPTAGAGQQPNSNPGCGDPIYPGTGAVVEQESDFSVVNTGFSLARTYSSRITSTDEGTIRLFGRHWTSRFDTRMVAESDNLLNPEIPACVISSVNNKVFCPDLSSVLTRTAVPAVVSVLRPSGGREVFRMVNGVAVGEADSNSRLTTGLNSNNEITWTFVDGDSDEIEKFAPDGKLLSISTRAGVTQTLTYSTGASNDTSVSRFPADAPICTHVQANELPPAGRLMCVTDNWGRQVQFEYTSVGQISKVISPDNQTYTYKYGGVTGNCQTSGGFNVACPNYLTSIVYPDGKEKIYHYNEAALINYGVACSSDMNVLENYGSVPNLLTGITDENGTRTLSWGYDCAGYATTSEHAGGVDKVEMTYRFSVDGADDRHTVKFFSGMPGNAVATNTTWLYKRVLGVPKFYSMPSGSCEGRCPTTTEYKFDANGNVTYALDLIGNVTNYEYDLTRNLETKRITAVGKPIVQTTSTIWHATLNVPAQINSPLRKTSFTHDANGNVLTRSEQATSDADGSQGASAAAVGNVRTWTYTYNNVGQILTATGPRTDVLDKTIYAYDTKGNLASITNAVGHVTSLSDYDGNGRVGRITDANGLVTTYTYSPRGWVRQRTVTGGGASETTNYDYDAAGQVIQVRMPDNSSISLTYDDAHRLIKISDNLGNSINYTLDLLGNRVAENVTDNGGNLSRQITRVFGENKIRAGTVTGVVQ
ncbi:RHS repeat protein [Undibacterium sp. CY18W]|uniref:RHS repeat protein n=1 Tax=Undibacterium hunanense TaxID=2762292 RepID=A0ABR6ZK91_9BURK|nr:DUF6531 domain-containing protein [Undibacterium hunanense]MBC3915989.1 RHS repeat protein [Undibacterium hunanense]